MSFSLPQSFKTTPQEKLVGLFIIFAISAFIYLSTLKSSLKDNQPSIILHTEIKQSYGMTPGAPIKLAGVDIGEVINVDLLVSGVVSITVSLPAKYANLYTSDSTLKIDSQFGFDSVLTGQGMLFVPGEEHTLLLSEANIKTQEPQSLADLTKEFNLTQLSENIGNVVDNLNQITTNIANKEDNINSLLSNVETLTGSLNSTVNQLPQTLHQLDTLISSLNNQVLPIFDKLDSRLIQSENLINSTDELMQQLQYIAVSTQPIITQVPSTLTQVDKSLSEVKLLTQQLRSLWYLGGKDNQVIKKTNEINIPYYNNTEVIKELLNDNNKE
jgi:phospholipid/cholesterol/gamma-HCH transport system substrate-binding protein